MSAQSFVDLDYASYSLGSYSLFQFSCFAFVSEQIYNVSVGRYVVLDICSAYDKCNHDIDPSDLLLFSFASNSDHHVAVYGMFPSALFVFRFHNSSSPL